VKEIQALPKIKKRQAQDDESGGPAKPPKKKKKTKLRRPAEDSEQPEVTEDQELTPEQG
jgi:hypothetical protein